MCSVHALMMTDALGQHPRTYRSSQAREMAEENFKVRTPEQPDFML